MTVYIDSTGGVFKPCSMCYLARAATFRVHDHNTQLAEENNGNGLFPFFLCKEHAQELQLKLAKTLYEEKYL